MKKYAVTVWRTGTAVVEVEAEDELEAIDKVSIMVIPDKEWEHIEAMDDYQVEEE